MNPDPWMSRKEIAAEVQCDIKTVQTWIDGKKLKAFQPSPRGKLLIRRSWFNAFLEAWSTKTLTPSH